MYKKTMLVSALAASVLLAGPAHALTSEQDVALEEAIGEIKQIPVAFASWSSPNSLSYFQKISLLSQLRAVQYLSRVGSDDKALLFLNRTLSRLDGCSTGDRPDRNDLIRNCSLQGAVFASIDAVVNPFVDSDGDTVADAGDNCPAVFNTDQLDLDSDGLGDACDTDADGDNVADAVDNCLLLPNPDQANLDGDSFGDLCDLDQDNDNVADIDDNCPTVFNREQLDPDGDGYGLLCDVDGDFGTAFVVMWQDQNENGTLDYDQGEAPFGQFPGGNGQSIFSYFEDSLGFYSSNGNGEPGQYLGSAPLEYLGPAGGIIFIPPQTEFISWQINADLGAVDRAFIESQYGPTLLKEFTSPGGVPVISNLFTYDFDGNAGYYVAINDALIPVDNALYQEDTGETGTLSYVMGLGLAQDPDGDGVLGLTDDCPLPNDSSYQDTNGDGTILGCD